MTRILRKNCKVAGLLLLPLNLFDSEELIPLQRPFLVISFPCVRVCSVYLCTGVSVFLSKWPFTAMQKDRNLVLGIKPNHSLYRLSEEKD